MIDVTIKKVWNDNNNEFGKRPSAITLQIKNGDNIVKYPIEFKGAKKYFTTEVQKNAPLYKEYTYYCIRDGKKYYAECVENTNSTCFKIKFNDDDIFIIGGAYVYTSSGKVIELPKGSNVIDLACYTDLEKTLIGAKVNDEEVQLDHVLRNKDRVITFTSLEEQDGGNWIDKANTSFAKKKLKSFG